jgi:hypothetical protein
MASIDIRPESAFEQAAQDAIGEAESALNQAAALAGLVLDQLPADATGHQAALEVVVEKIERTIGLLTRASHAGRPQ